MRSGPIGRRSFLAALGAAGVFAGATRGGRAFGGDAAATGTGTGGQAGGAAAGPLRGALATGSGRPLRFVAVYTPHGRAHELWQPRDGFDLRFPESVLRPFDDPETFGRTFRDRLIVIDGIDLAAGIAAGTSGHDGPRVILTGSGADGRNASIDQFLAAERGLGAETPHTSVVLGIGNDDPDIKASISYAAGAIPIPKWIDPAQSFAELFGEALTGARAEELERKRRAGRSVLDAVRADLSRLSARAPASERMKMEQHQAALRDIEKRLGGLDRACTPPFAYDRAHFPDVRAHGGGARFLDPITDLQIDLLARALACDLTRFATLFLGDLSHTRLFPELPEDVHSDVAHRYDARSGKHPGDPATWTALATQNRYSYSKVARLLSRLDEAGILDDTLVLVSGDMGDPARHLSRSVPTLVAGGCGGRFKMGRYLDLRGGGPEEGGVPNNRLLVSICHAFGVDVPRFGHAGDPRVVTGDLPALAG
jgi:hypothetical protein